MMRFSKKRNLDMNQKSLCTLLVLLAAVGMLANPAAFAQENTVNEDIRPPVIDRSDVVHISKDALRNRLDAINVVDVARGIDTLPDEIEPTPQDSDVADTALVFTNMSRSTTAVKCVAFNKNGRPIGRTRTVVPPLGLRYVLASDMSNGVDFVGQVQCAPRGRIVGSVVFIGPAVTDLPVHNGKLGESRIRFPLVAHY
jgi:hypothetical protein